MFQWVVHKQKFSTFGIKLDSKGQSLFGEGAVAGLIYVAGYFLITLLSGQAHVNFSDISSIIPTLRLAITAFLGHLPEVLFCETLFRGCILKQLSSRHKPVASLTITSVLYTIYCLLLYRSGPYPWVYGINCFLLSVILCLMVLSSKSLMPVLGKEIAFGVAQGILLGTQHNIESIISLVLSQNIFTGYPGPITSGFALTIVLIIGLAYEINHMKNHLD